MSLETERIILGDAARWRGAGETYDLPERIRKLQLGDTVSLCIRNPYPMDHPGWLEEDLFLVRIDWIASGETVRYGGVIESELTEPNCEGFPPDYATPGTRVTFSANDIVTIDAYFGEAA